VNGGQWQVSTDGGIQPLWARNGEELFYWAPTGALMSVKIDREALESRGRAELVRRAEANPPGKIVSRCVDRQAHAGYWEPGMTRRIGEYGWDFKRYRELCRHDDQSWRNAVLGRRIVASTRRQARLSGRPGCEEV
jgi:hypothetical protein